MPTNSKVSCTVVTAKNGYTRVNTSWVISRVVRDFDAWMDKAVRDKLDRMLEERHRYMKRHTSAGTVVPKPGQTGLCISVYEPSKTRTAGEPAHDFVYWSGLGVTTIQLAIAFIPLGKERDWTILMITLSGTALALLTGCLPQWKNEKWACRRGSHNDYILTRGNGTQHAILILGNGKGLNLEDLAVSSRMNYASSGLRTRLCLAIVSVLWICLLIAAAGIKTNTEYLLGIGGIGMLQNAFVIGWRRNPSALGVHLEFRAVVGQMTAMGALLELEAKYPASGKSLLPIFFPGKLLPEEDEAWERLAQRGRQAQPQQGQPQTQPGATSSPAPALTESWASHAQTYETRPIRPPPPAVAARPTPNRGAP